MIVRVSRVTPKILRKAISLKARQTRKSKWLQVHCSTRPKPQYVFRNTQLLMLLSTTVWPLNRLRKVTPLRPKLAQLKITFSGATCLARLSCSSQRVATSFSRTTHIENKRHRFCKVTNRSHSTSIQSRQIRHI